MRCSGLHVWTGSLTRSVSRNSRLSTGDSAGAPGLFSVYADTAAFGSEDATPGSHACVRVCAPLGRVWRAGLPGAFWCASPFPVAGLGALFACFAPSGLGLPRLKFLLCFFSFSLCAPVVAGIPCFSGQGCLEPWRLVVPPPSPLFLPSPLPPPLFFACLSFVFCLFFFFSSFFPILFFLLSSCAGCAVLGGLCVLGWGLCWCVLLWAVCPGGGRFALALCGSVLPGCACSLCVVACRVARVRLRRAGGVSLPRAPCGALLVCFVRLSCSTVFAACCCPWVLWWGGPVASGLVVLFRLALVCVVLVSLMWCSAPLWGAVWCCPPPPSPPPGCCALFFLCFVGCVLAVLPPQRLVVVP